MKILFWIFFFVLSFVVKSSAQEGLPEEIHSPEITTPTYQVSKLLTFNPSLLPVYLTSLSNINDYDIFANGGWDGNWYVGYNVCWIQKISTSDLDSEMEYRKAFVGAKLGRAKTRRKAGKPIWEKEPIPGDIYIAISNISAWKASQRYFLVSTEDIPLESDWENALNNVGESRWFWREVPLEQIDFNGSNFIALWSPSKYFICRDTAPILCGGWGARGSKTNTWLNDEIQGAPPIKSATSLKKSISVFEPAIAIKLIPEGTEQEIVVNIVDIREGKGGTVNKIISASIIGSHIERAWMEVAVCQAPETLEESTLPVPDRVTGTGTELNSEPVVVADLSASFRASASEAADLEWKKVSRYLFSPPYVFTLDPNSLPTGKIYVRIAAEDTWSNRGYSDPVEMLVER